MMVPMRGDQKWKEAKLGRIFRHRDVVQLSAKRREVRQSVYVSAFEGVDKFFPKLERHLVGYRNLVILGDGADWIWRWAEDNYPGAQQILDFYHAREKLVVFAKHQFAQDDTRIEWVKTQSDRLLKDELEKVMTTVKSLRARNPEAKHTKSKLLNYYQTHDDRMAYKTYRDQGLLIGSGPIEAAHRSVLQQRMNLSGQQWSLTGAKAIANLRCYHSSRAWNQIEQIVKVA